MYNVKRIITGWINVLIRAEHVEEAAAERLGKCQSCPSVELSDTIALLRHPITRKAKKCDAQDCVCGACGCPLLAKSRSPEDHCPRGRWGESYLELKELIDEAETEEITLELKKRIKEMGKIELAING